MTVLQGDSRSVLGLLAAEEVEIAVVGALFEEEGVEFTPVARDEVILIAGAGHRWHGADAITGEELCSEPLVMREAGSGTGKAIMETLKGCGIDPAALKIAARLGSNEAVKRAVLNGLGVSFVSAKSVERELAQGALVQVPVQGVAIRREFYLGKRKGRELSPAACAFLAIMEESGSAAESR